MPLIKTKDLLGFSKKQWVLNIIEGISLKKLLTRNEAIAEGIIESGVEVVSGYQGTPPTEVILILLPQKRN